MESKGAGASIYHMAVTLRPLQQNVKQIFYCGKPLMFPFIKKIQCAYSCNVWGHTETKGNSDSIK